MGVFAFPHASQLDISQSQLADVAADLSLACEREHELRAELDQKSEELRALADKTMHLQTNLEKTNLSHADDETELRQTRCEPVLRTFPADDVKVRCWLVAQIASGCIREPAALTSRAGWQAGV